MLGATPGDLYAQVSPTLMGAARIDGDRSASVALCTGDTWFDCRFLCGGTLIAPNLVLTSRHCADVVKLDSLDCETYRFSGSLIRSDRVWVSAASRISNDGRFHQGRRWDIPLSMGCGHDVALLTLADSIAEDEARFSEPAIDASAVSKAESEPILVVGYGGTAPGAAADGQRRRVDARVVCIGGRDRCETIPGGRELLPSEFITDATVCPGDSGSGAFTSSGLVLGPLARSLGGTNPCAFGVYAQLSTHTLLLTRSARTAAEQGQYPVPKWVAVGETQGNDVRRPSRAFGARCDGDIDCSSGTCRSKDGGLRWECVDACGSACSGTCRPTEDGPHCFDERAPPAESCCVVGPVRSGGERVAAVMLLGALMWCSSRRRRKSMP